MQNIQEIVTLLNAGYTKEQIDAMYNAQSAPTQPAATTPTQPQAVVTTPAQPAPVVVPAQPTQTQPAAPAPVAAQPQAVAQPAPAQPTPAQPSTPAPVSLTAEQLQQLIQGVAVQTVSGVIETPPTAEDVLNKMYAAVIGDAPKEE